MHMVSISYMRIGFPMQTLVLEIILDLVLYKLMNVL